MLVYILKVTACWAVFYLIYAAFLSKETFFRTNRWYLLVTLLLGAGIPLLEFLPIFHPDNLAVVYLQPISESVFYVQATVNQVVTTPSFDWMQVFWGIYFVGVAVVGLRFFIGLGKIIALYRSSEVVQKNNYQLVLTNQLHLPFSFFNYLFWSKDFEVNDADGQKIITHEEAHVNGWHSVDVLLSEILSIIFWCSPMVYFYKKSIKTVHEYLADAVVLQTTQTKQYGHLLLRQSQSGLQVALANHFFHSQLKQRIVMMTRSKSRKKALVKYLVAFPVILLFLIIFSKKEALANLDKNPIIENIFTVENDVDEMPRFPGCEDKTTLDEKQKCSNEQLLRHVYTNIKYPAAARKAGVQGKVIVKFVVGEDGNISKAWVAKDIGEGCGEEALRVINTLPKMIPGKKDGKNVAVEMVIPVNFKLEGDNAKPIKKEKTGASKSSLGSDVTVIGMTPPSVVTSDEVFKVVEEMPVFAGCGEITDSHQRKICSDKTLLDFVYNRIKYPEQARNQNIQGTVITQFIIQKDGSVSGAKIVRGIGNGCDEEVLRIVNEMPTWIPGKQNGKAVNFEFSMPVKFKLDDNSDPLSLNLENDKDPIYVVDGRVVSKFTIGKLKKTENIESIHVLKGEKAIAKYGEKGKNGVIEIQTKSSQLGIFDEKIFKVVEEMPRFAGCENQGLSRKEKDLCAQQKMLEFIYSNLKYPAEARENCVQGKVIVQLVIDEKGNVTNPLVLRGIGAGCNKETMRVVQAMPKWIPGKQGGKNVAVQLVLPVSFKVDCDGENDSKTGDPLIVIDGKVWESGKENIKKLNPENIETINVLKGKAAIEKYGEAAQNGALEITMKKGTLPESIFEDSDKSIYFEPEENTASQQIQGKHTMQDVGLEWVKISPNPTSGVINIEMEADELLMEIVGYDMYGKELFRRQTYGGKRTISDIDIKNAPKGNVLIAFKKGNKVYTEIVVVQ